MIIVISLFAGKSVSKHVLVICKSDELPPGNLLSVASQLFSLTYTGVPFVHEWHDRFQFQQFAVIQFEQTS